MVPCDNIRNAKPANIVLFSGPEIWEQLGKHACGASLFTMGPLDSVGTSMWNSSMSARIAPGFSGSFQSASFYDSTWSANQGVANVPMYNNLLNVFNQQSGADQNQMFRAMTSSPSLDAIYTVRVMFKTYATG